MRDKATKAPLFEQAFQGRTLKIVRRKDRSPLLILYEVGPGESMVQRLQVGLRCFGDPETEAGIVSLTHTSRSVPLVCSTGQSHRAVA